MQKLIEITQCHEQKCHVIVMKNNNVMIQLDYALLYAVEHRPQTTSISSALLRAAISASQTVQKP